MESEYVCEVCGKPLPPHRRRFCSDLCSRKGRKTVTVIRKILPRKCRWCDKPIKAGEFCSEGCRAMWERQEKFSHSNRGAIAERVRDRKLDVTIDDVVQGMQETGLQYGEYVRRYNK